MFRSRLSPIISGLILLALAACDTPSQVVVVGPPQDVPEAVALQVQEGPLVPQTRESFRQIVRQMEPVVERECRRRSPELNCDFSIRVFEDPRFPPNAFQTLDEDGRPVLGFTVALIADVRNADELAFVLGHEAAHHIAGHIGRQEANANLGAAVFGALQEQIGGDSRSVQRAQSLGAAVGARSFSKEFELEADELGTILTALAGYDPILGAAYFARIPDPGNRFLGTHPPNAQRIAVVRATAARL
ncbi:MAG: M48 family metalloprotease [Pseudomonadota bacterium]